jgi:hypothetical protein
MAQMPDPDEAAAIAAAVERFQAEIQAGGEGEGAKVGPWQRAALLEGVGAKGTALQDPQGGHKWLS